MKKVFTVYAHRRGGQLLWEGDFTSYEQADDYIMYSLSLQYAPVSKQDTENPVMRFNIEINYVLPNE